MATKITFTLDVEKEKFDDIISNIQRIDELELREDKHNKGDIICNAILSKDDTKEAVHLCYSMFSIDGVKSIKIFTTTIPDKIIDKPNRYLPHIPMVLSSAVTFFVIYGVLGTLGQDLNILDIFNLAGIPTIVVFLSQLGYATQELWIQELKKIHSK